MYKTDSFSKAFPLMVNDNFCLNMSAYLFQILSAEDLANQNLRDTQVLNTKENKMWDWDLIGYVLKVRQQEFKQGVQRRMVLVVNFAQLLMRWPI